MRFWFDMEGVTPREPYFYSAEFFEDIRSKIDLTDDEVAILKDGLERAALVWQKTKHAEESEPDPNAYSKKLDRLYRHTNAAAESLRAMPEEVWHVLERCIDFWEEYEQPPSVSSTGCEAAGDCRFTISGGCKNSSDKKPTSITPDALAGLLEDISWLAERPQLLFPPKKGPRSNFPLMMWLCKIATVWDGKLNRRFVRGYSTNGQSNSDATILCVTAYNVLDPKVPPSRVENEMKKLISRSRGKFV